MENNIIKKQTNEIGTVKTNNIDTNAIGCDRCDWQVESRSEDIIHSIMFVCPVCGTIVKPKDRTYTDKMALLGIIKQAERILSKSETNNS